MLDTPKAALCRSSEITSPKTVLSTATETPKIDTLTLFQGHNTVELDHAGQRYLLRLTRENKLILTK